MSSRSRKQYRKVDMAARSSAAVPSQTRCEAMRCSSARMTRRAWARGGHVQVDQFFDRQRVGQVVADRVQVVQPVGHHLGLLVGLGFHVLLDAGVQETDIGDAVDHDLAVQFQQQAQHAVRGGMLRTHVQQHRLAAHRPFGDQVLQVINGDFENIRHVILAPYSFAYGLRRSISS